MRDLGYRQRRNEIAQMALDYQDGEPCPEIDYTDTEHRVWREVWGMLQPLLQVRADSVYLDCLAEFTSSFERIPTFAHINGKLAASSGFQLVPVAGLVAPRAFFSYLQKKIFLSTQYTRHPADPLFSPEPDVLHELIGHAVSLSDPGTAEASRLLGNAARDADQDKITALERLYWFWMEFGVVAVGDSYKAVGAALLSSPRELETFERDKELRPWDIDEIIETPYDPGEYQERLFVASSRSQAFADIRSWIESH